MIFLIQGKMLLVSVSVITVGEIKVITIAVEMRCAFHFPHALYIVKIKLGPSSQIIQFYLADVHGDPLASPPSSQPLLEMVWSRQDFKESLCKGSRPGRH